MKRITTILIVFFMTIYATQAQTIQPAKKVQSAKSSGDTFEEVNLFEAVNPKNSENQIPKEFKEYTIFSIQQEKMASLKSNAPETMSLQIPGKKSLISLELVKVNITTDDFTIVEMPAGKTITPSKTISHYRGIIKGNPKSIAAISILDNEVSGLISIEGDPNNMVLAKLDNNKNHILYEDKDITHLDDFVCQTPDTHAEHTKELPDVTIPTKNQVKCPRIFFDIGNDIVRDKGGAQRASNHIQSLFNQVAILYANENVKIKLSGLNAWTSSTPFNGLENYRTYRNRNAFNGDLGHFVTYNFSGGVAWVNALCGSYKYAVSGIARNFSNVPRYSWSVSVVAHELGHNFGSQHTHSCSWNGNNTAIDGCYTTQGGCGRPGIPSGGGTIMSYCHLTSAGIDFNKGFGTQPGNVIRRTINAARCVATCDDGNTGGGGTDGEEVSCDGIPFWSSNLTYPVGYLVVSDGHLFRLSNSNEWIQLGVCNSGPCVGVAQWTEGTIYNIGARVVNDGSLFERIRGGNGWKQISSCSRSSSASIAPNIAPSINTSGFTYYPNPAKDILTVETRDITDTSATLYIKDIKGNILQNVKINTATPNKTSTTTLDMSMLSKGMYFIQMVSAEKTITQKVFKK